MTPDQQAFEDRCWEHYLAERARRTMPGDVEGEPTREGLFWRREDGLYGVLAFNTAWMAYQWGMEAVRGQGVPDGLTLAVIGHKHFGNPIPQPWYAAAKELLASAQQASAKFEVCTQRCEAHPGCLCGEQQGADHGR